MVYINRDAFENELQKMITARNRVISGVNTYSKEAKEKAHTEKRILTQIKSMLNDRKLQKELKDE